MDRREFLQASALAVADRWMPASHVDATAQNSSSGMSIYVAPHGTDSHPGTQQRPFASLQRAQQEARALKQRTTQPITIWVRGGTYYLDAPLVFTPEDSGTAEAPISYMAYPQEIVTISGGRKLNCRWKPFKNRIMQSSLSDGSRSLLTSRSFSSMASGKFELATQTTILKTLLFRVRAILTCARRVSLGLQQNFISTRRHLVRPGGASHRKRLSTYFPRITGATCNGKCRTSTGMKASSS